MSTDTLNMLLNLSEQKLEEQKESALIALKWITSELENNNIRGAASKLNSLNENLNGALSEDGFIRGLKILKEKV